MLSPQRPQKISPQRSQRKAAEGAEQSDLTPKETKATEDDDCEGQDFRFVIEDFRFMRR